MLVLLLDNHLAPAAPALDTLCQHCHERKRNAARGLCSQCHRQPEVRALYPLRSRTPALEALCQHCHERKRSRPRGLCRRCHSNPKIRRLYPPVSAWGRRTFDCQGPRKLPPATAAVPGSAEKIRVLEERVRKKLALHHPRDYKIAD